MALAHKALGIVVSGGPAPGINSVISSAVIEARNRGVRIYGLREGFVGISQFGERSLVELTIPDVSTVHNVGGSILGTSRFNPLTDSSTRERFLKVLKDKEITGLIVIGGDGSAYLSGQLTKEVPELSVVHVPKTIDNDLVLPNQHPSFGFETARHASQEILDTLMVDARTTGRWFLVTTMGRRAGFLALGAGLAAGVTLTLIPEEFRDAKVSTQHIAELIFSTVKKRADSGRPYGVVLCAEGLAECLELSQQKDLPRDDLGRPRFSEIELGDLIIGPLQNICREAGLPTRFIRKNIGYELRCKAPIAFDIEYTRFLGFGAVEFLLNGLRGVMVCRDFDRLSHYSLIDSKNSEGRLETRSVDLKSDIYRVARSFMIR